MNRFGITALLNTSLVLAMLLAHSVACDAVDDPGVDDFDTNTSGREPEADLDPESEFDNYQQPWLEIVPDVDIEGPEHGVLRGGHESKPYLIASIERSEGSVEFFDRAEAIGRVDGGVSILATGMFAEPVARILEESDATALEVYLAIEPDQLSVPARLYDDHAETAEAFDHIPDEPRSYFDPDVTAALTINTISNQCSSSSTYSLWKASWKAWSLNYGNQVSCASVTSDVNITTWSSAPRALGACYHLNTCGTDGASISFWGWSGWSWNYIASYAFSGGSPLYGQAVYFGESGPAIGQNQGRLRNVTSGCETVYVGVRSQIPGGSDQC